jgi:hypothetical protein
VGARRVLNVSFHEPLADRLQFLKGALLVLGGDDVYQHPDTNGRNSGKAIQHGIALAKRSGAKVTALTVLPPFHVFTADTQTNEDTPAQYKAHMQKHAEKTLHGRHGISAIVLGSETVKVLTHCKIPVQDSGAGPSMSIAEPRNLDQEKRRKTLAPPSTT